MYLSHYRKYGFTIIEVLIGLIATGIGVLAIMGSIQSGSRIMTMTRAQVVATNLAREGIEAVFNKRDTNRLLFPSKKDQCRLANSTSSTGTTCENDTRIGSRSGPDGWAFSGSTNTTNQPLLRSIISQDNTQVNGPFKFHPVIFVNSLAGFTGKNYNPIKSFTRAGNVASKGGCGTPENIKNELQVCLVNGKRGPCGTLDDSCNWTSTAGAQINTKYGQFRRYITTQGIINKNNNTDFSNDCTSGGAEAKCADGSPKELRFCSIVDYIVDSSARRVELCSVITNFEK